MSNYDRYKQLERFIDQLSVNFSLNPYLSGLAKLECAGLLGYNGALVLGLQLGDQLGLQTAGLLGVQVTHLLGDINKRGQHLE